MATSQNGWPVIPDTDAGRAKLTDLVLPGTMPHKVRVLSGDVHTIAEWHVREYQKRVEPIKPAGCWGWNVRKIGNGPDWSNHASATAWDLNAPDNPDGAPPSKVMTPAQIRECHELEAESDGVLRWGGDWSDPDPMHWEVVGSRAAAAELAKKIRESEDDVSAADVITALKSAEGKAAVYAAVNQDKVQRYDSSGAAIKPDPDPNKPNEHLMTWASALAYLGRDVLLLRTAMAALSGKDFTDEPAIVAGVVAALGGSSDADLAAALKVALGDRAAAVAALLAA